MAIFNWQYDDLKKTIKEILNNEGDNDSPHREILFHCLLHFERLDLWFKRIQEAQYYEESERRHVQRKLRQIKEIIEKDSWND